jgi:hypothetical protein
MLAARLLRLTDPLDWLIAAGLLAAAQLVVVSLVVGAAVDHFDPWPLMLCAAAWDALLAAAVVLQRPESAGVRASVAAAAAAARGLRPWQLVVVVAAGLALAWRLVLAVVLPPFAYDSLAYHLTAVAEWVQSGRIGPNPYALCCSRYPSNAELLFAWPTVFLGRDTVTDAVQILTALVGSLAVTGLARAAGVAAPASLTAGALFLLTPIVLTQANTDYNDVTVAALFLVALYFGVRLFTTARPTFALLAGAAAGLVLGTKTNGIVFAAAVAVPVLGFLAYAAGTGRLAGRRAAAAGISFAGAALLLGGWWYGRNWIDTGNPVWPFQVDVLGHEVFRGTSTVGDYLTVPPGSRGRLYDVGRSWYQDLTFWTRSDYSYEERSGGLGPLWSWLGWPSLALGALYLLRRRRDLAVSMLLPAVLAFGLLPYRWWSRFTIYLAALGAVAVVAIVERVPAPRLRLLLATAVVGLALTGGALASWRLDPAGFGRKMTATDVLVLAAHPSRPRTVGSLFFREFAWLEDAPPRATVAVEWDAPSIRFLYPLFGTGLDRRVVLLFRGQQDRVDAVLAGRGARYLFVEDKGLYAQWARARPARYRAVSTDRGTAVFRRLGG